MAKFELFKSGANQNFYFRFISTAENQLLRSEGYTGKSSCSNGIESVKKNAPLDGRYDRKDSNGNYSFNLKAANGEIIATSSKIYDTSSARDAAIETIKKEAPGASVVDLT
jgi:hypothetical protein